MVVMSSKHGIYAVHAFVPVLPFCLSYCAAIRPFGERAHPRKIRSLPTKDHDLIGSCRSLIMLIQRDDIKSSSHRSRSRQQTRARCARMVGPTSHSPYLLLAILRIHGPDYNQQHEHCKHHGNHRGHSLVFDDPIDDFELLPAHQ